ncbi:ATP-dependent helicase [Elysia marginata]|uniref:ATP-dependent helicase n=1 Tax=Elysia marginata TaxID=1093978 RepID=A0AAV4H519_9GAST|nr:ATP-dependent helicase [Elysia marginata]
MHQYSKKTWQRRKRGRQVEVGVYEAAAIGRIYTISPKRGDCFYLRLLLLSIPGPTSFQMLRTVNGTTHESYRDAYLALGLLEDDNIHRQTLQEACISQSPHSLEISFLSFSHRYVNPTRQSCGKNFGMK